MVGRIYHASDRERIEQSLQGVKLVVISRHDKNVGWMIMQDERTYMELSLADTKITSGTFKGCELSEKRLGEEMVHDVKARKSQVKITCPDKTAYDGTMWMTRDGITVKMEAMVTDGEQKYPFRLDLKNIRIAKQDPQLFEIPEGYQKLGIAGMLGAFGAMMQGLPEQEATVEIKDPGEKRP